MPKKINFNRLNYLADRTTKHTEKIYLGKQKELVSSIDEILKLSKRKSAVPKTTYLNKVKKIQGTVDFFHKDLHNYIISDGANISNNVAEVYRLREPYLKNDTIRLLRDSINKKTYGTTVNRKIKNINKIAKQNINKILLNGSIKHTEPKILLKEINNYINGKSGGLRYMINRLIRTQNSKILKDSIVNYNKKSKLTNGLKWHLSTTHKVEDICDIYATYDSGLGVGVYSADAVPDDHPNGRCFVTDVLMPTNRIGEEKDVSKFKLMTLNKVTSIISNDTYSRNKLILIKNQFNHFIKNYQK